MKIVAFDTETYYDKECSVKTLGNWGYVHHPAFECYMISVYDGESSWVGHPKDFDSKKWLEGNLILSHNAGFDVNVYQRLLEDGTLPPVEIPEWHCTADLAAYICGFRALKQASEHLFGAKLSKAQRGKAEGMRYEDFLAEGPDRWKAMCEYAVDDVIYCWNIWNHFSQDWPEVERRLSDESVAASLAGVGVNWELLAEYERKVSNELQRVHNALPWSADQPPTSPLAIAAACQAIGIAPPPVRSKDEEAYQEWLDAHKETAPWIPMISEYRKLNKMLTFVKAVDARRRTDGRIDAQLLYFGAHTGRWAGTIGESNSAGVNLQNLRKEPLELSDGFEVHQRHVFGPAPGHKYVIADYAQIEARVVNWLAGNHKLLQLLESQDMSIYEAHARATMGWSGGVLKDEDPKKYALAKARVLMLGYGAGWVKFQATAFKALKLTLSDAEAYHTVKDFRATNPEIQNLWWTLGDLLREASDKPKPENVAVVELPSWRELLYYEVTTQIRTREVTKVLEDVGGSISIKKEMKVVSELSARTGARMSRAYGGLMTENLVQAVARDIFALGLLALLDRGWRVPIHVHDEFVVEVPKSTEVAEVASVILSARPEWAAGCPIDVEAGEAPHYLKD